MPDIYVNPDAIPDAVLDAMKESLERRAATPQQAAALRAYLGEVDFPDGARVLDIGCGTGPQSRAIAAIRFSRSPSRYAWIKHTATERAPPSRASSSAGRTASGSSARSRSSCPNASGRPLPRERESNAEPIRKSMSIPSLESCRSTLGTDPVQSLHAQSQTKAL